MLDDGLDSASSAALDDIDSSVVGTSLHDSLSPHASPASESEPGITVFEEKLVGVTLSGEDTPGVDLVTSLYDGGSSWVPI